MNFNHDELCKLEWENGRILRAVSQFADKETRRVIDQAMYVMAEVRNAAGLLCDPHIAGDTRELAIERLMDLFRKDEP